MTNGDANNKIHRAPALSEGGGNKRRVYLACLLVVLSYAR